MRRRLALVVGAGCLAFAASAWAGPPQVTIYLPGFGQPQSPPPAQASPQQQPPPNLNALTLQAEVAIAQAAAYQRYLQYVAVTQAARGGGGGDPSQYFTNGAAATTVPLAGPGSAYFNNGAEATRVPSPQAARPTQSPPPPPPPPDSPQPMPRQQAAAPSAPLAPFWWVEGQTPPAAPAPVAAVASATAPPPPPPESADDRPSSAMSFEDWLQSMGSNVQAAVAGDTSLTSAEVESAPLAEPAEAVLEVRARLPSLPREKTRPRAVAGGGSSDVITPMVGTFAAGLLLGALAMRRPRVRAPLE